MESEHVALVRSLVSEGVFGDVQLVELKDEVQEIGIQYASTLGFLSLVLKAAGQEQVLSLVVKRVAADFDNTVMFRNELAMYKEVMPALRIEVGLCPKFYYGFVPENATDKIVLILDNLKTKGYQNSKKSPFLDFEHISMAMKKIAKFHSFSYAFKQENLEKIKEMGKMLKQCVDYGPEFEVLHFTCLERGVNGFLSSNGPEEIFSDFLAALKKPSDGRITLTSPDEPFGVICHGDFCNNNVMYKYDKEGSPEDCVLFDFQTSIYGSPAIDLAFYLYMHTTAATREKHWDQYLKIYWDTLQENVSSNVKIPSFEQFLEHFATRAVYGYVLAGFFLPVVIDPSLTFWDDGRQLEERVQSCKTMGGNEMEERIVDIVSHLYQRKYIHAFLDFVKGKK